MTKLTSIGEAHWCSPVVLLVFVLQSNLNDSGIVTRWACDSHRMWWYHLHQLRFLNCVIIFKNSNESQKLKTRRAHFTPNCRRAERDLQAFEEIFSYDDHLKQNVDYEVA